jgi:hypothetical protein
MDTLHMLGSFLNVVAIAFVVVIFLIAVGLITAIIMLVKKVKPSGKGTRPTRRRKASPSNQRYRQLNRQSPNRSRFRTRRKPV